MAAARLGARYRSGGARRRWDGSLPRVAHQTAAREDSVHGPLMVLRLLAEPDTAGLAVSLEFALPEEHPFFLWRLTALNDSAQLVHVDWLEMLAVGSERQADWLWPARPLWRMAAARAVGSIRLSDTPGEMAFFTNGWQSWGYSGALGPRDHYPYSRLGPLTSPLKVNSGTPQPFWRGRFSSDMFGVVADRVGRVGILAGFLSQLGQFGTVEAFADSHVPALRVWANCDGVPLDPGGKLETDWAVLQFIRLDDPDPLGPYLEAAGRQAKARVNPEAHTPVGWCSWYQFFERVTEQDILRNLEALRQGQAELPLSVFQLDDGYEADVGDWFERNPKFPHDLRWLSDRIRASGLKPGLWLAPFSAKPTAQIERQHPDWVLRHSGGRPVNAGYVFHQWSHALDVTHPAVLEHVQELIRTAVNDWGFPYLKLDFLYMGALPGRRYDPRLTRAQALRRALQAIREAAGPDTFLLGCGCPLGSGIGIFDGMRISADVDTRWEPSYQGITFFFRGEPDAPSARNAIRNTLTRAPMHRRWWLNDPDCLTVRDTQTHLSEAEVLSLATVIALSGGMFLLSDDLPSLSPGRRDWIGPLLPVMGRAARALDWMDSPIPAKLVLPMSGPSGEWWVIGLFNWEDRARDLSLNLQEFGLDPGRTWHVLDFWNQRYARAATGELGWEAIPAHGGLLLAVRAAQSDRPVQWVGSSLHFTQGFEVARWQSSPAQTEFELDLGRKASGTIWLEIPGSLQAVEVGGHTVTPIRVEKHTFQVPVEVPGRAHVLVRTGD